MNPGLFLDMRANRLAVSRVAKNLSVLNCFSYTCTFGVYCQAHGANRVVNLDISSKALAWGKTNYLLNKFVPQDENFVAADCLTYLKGAAKWKNRFDLIILDPPSFARHRGQIFSVKKDMAQLIDRALVVLNPNGKLFVASNCSDITSMHLESWIRKGSQLSGRSVKSCNHMKQDIDFPGTNTVKASHLAAVFAKF